MSTDDPLAAEAYLQRHSTSFWEWVDHGEAIRWVDGPTIVVRGELPHLLQPLESNGLPPLSLVLLVLAACRGTWSNAEGEVLNRLIDAHPQFAERGGGRMWLEAVVRNLAKIADLPADTRTDTPSKTTLVEMVLEQNTQRTSPEVAEAVVALLAGRSLPEAVFEDRERRVPVSLLTRDFQGLCDAVQRVTADGIDRRRRTGMEQSLKLLPAPNVEEEEEKANEPVGLTIRELLMAMEQDDALSGLATLTRNLLAVIHLPREVTEPEELPLGGVSDITNRGPFDRLLLSELANDSDTLMTRVALGEALYLRREKPPSNPPRQRLILIDSGIRMWGLPRVFATAVALSLSASASRSVSGERRHASVINDATRVFRADGDRLAAVDLSQTAGVSAHLEAIEPHVHVGDALRALVSELDPEMPADVVIVSCDEAFTDREFCRSLSASGIDGCYLASVRRDGRLRLMAHSHSGDRLVKEATLDLSVLLEETLQPVTPLVNDDRLHPLPAIFGLPTFPLRMAHNLDDTTTWSLDDKTVLAITPDRRLMHWTDAGCGALQLTDLLPGRGVMWKGSLPVFNQSCRAIVVENRHGGLCSLVLFGDDDGFGGDDGETLIVPLELRLKNLHCVTMDAGLLIAIHSDRASVINPLTGKVDCAMKIAGHLGWRHDRFFFGQDGWYCLCPEGGGGQLVMEPIVSTANRGPYDIVFHHRDLGMVAVTTDGRLSFLEREPEQIKNLPHRPAEDFVTVCEVGDEGLWIRTLWGATSEFTGRMMTHQLDPLEIRGATWDETTRGLVKQTNIRTRITLIGIVDGRLSLMTHKGRRLDLMCEPRSLLAEHVDAVEAYHWRLMLKRAESDHRDIEHRRAVIKAAAPEGVGYQLKVAEWADGSRAHVDSRGLLHLKSSDREIPEVTLVLADGNVSGWTSRGQFFGAPFYIGRHEPTSAAVIDRTILQPFVETILQDRTRVQNRAGRVS